MSDSNDPAAQPAALADLSTIPVADLELMGDSALAHTLRRVLDEVDDPHGSVTGFNSSI